MLRRWIALFLVFALISNCFSSLFVYAGFEANSKYISEKLCENRNKPWMHCNGHCYLMKKLKNALEKETRQQKNENNSGFQAIVTGTVLTLIFNIEIDKINFPNRLTPKLVHQSISIFQPPKLMI